MQNGNGEIKTEVKNLKHTFTLDERNTIGGALALDSEQKCFKQRADAVRDGVKRVSVWAKENLKDLAKGFEDQFKAVVEAHKERAE